MITFKWRHREDYEDALNRFVNENSATRLAKMFLRKEAISWTGFVGERFTEDSILENLMLFQYDALGDKLWYKVSSNAFLWGKLTSLHVIRALNTRFLHKESDIDALKLMQVLAPMIKPEGIFINDHTRLITVNEELALPYFKTLNSKITFSTAQRIYKLFQRPDGSGFIPADAQNWLVDNNEIIQSFIVQNDELELFPSSVIRELFLF